MTISNLTKMAESYPNGKKTLWEEEKLLVTSNISFSHSIFKKLVSQRRQKVSLCKKLFLTSSLECDLKSFKEFPHVFRVDAILNNLDLSTSSYSCKILNIWITSALCRRYSNKGKPIFLSLSLYGKFLRHGTIFVALLWTFSNAIQSLL